MTLKKPSTNLSVLNGDIRYRSILFKPQKKKNYRHRNLFPLKLHQNMSFEFGTQRHTRYGLIHLTFTMINFTRFT